MSTGATLRMESVESAEVDERAKAEAAARALIDGQDGSPVAEVPGIVLSEQAAQELVEKLYILEVRKFALKTQVAKKVSSIDAEINRIKGLYESAIFQFGESVLKAKKKISGRVTMNYGNINITHKDSEIGITDESEAAVYALKTGRYNCLRVELRKDDYMAAVPGIVAEVAEAAGGELPDGQTQFLAPGTSMLPERTLRSITFPKAKGESETAAPVPASVEVVEQAA